MAGILRLESLTKGNTLRQGDLTLLKYRLFDADGDKLDISGKPATVRLMKNDFTFIAYEKEGLTVAPDDMISFNVNKILPGGLYHLEIIVDDKYIFPSRADEGKFNVDKSSLGAEITIIENAGIDAVVRKAVDLINDDPSLIIDEDKLISEIIANTSVGSIEEYYQEYRDAIKEYADLKPKAEQSISKSAEALTKSQNALNLANGIDGKATNALSLSESADTLSKSVQEQFNQVVINGDSSVEAAQARVDASGQTNPTLKARLDKEHNEVTTQLAEMENHEFSNASGRLRIPSVYKTNQVMHPKVLKITSPRFGGTNYTYFMAFTSYPDSDRKTENPAVVASVDGIKWEYPTGVPQNLDDGFGKDSEYNSDTHLVYRPDTGTLECWYRYTNETTRIVRIKRRTTTDARTWTPEEVMLETNYDVDLVLSPAIIHQNGIYKMWYIAEDKMWYRESATGKSWSERIQKNVETNGYKLWHLDVISTSGGYEFLASAYTNDYYEQDLVHFASADNEVFNNFNVVMTPSTNNWDNQMLYRSTFLKEDSGYIVYYSARSKDNKWGTSLTTGKTMTSLNGSEQVAELMTVDEILLSGHNSWLNATSLSLKNNTGSFRQYPGDVPNSVSFMSDRPENRKKIKMQIGQVEFGRLNETESYLNNKNGVLRYNDVLKQHEIFMDDKFEPLSRIHVDKPNTRKGTDSIVTFPEGKITYTRIDSTSDSLSTFPFSAPGYLITDRVSPASGYSNQKYIVFLTGEILTRLWLPSGGWNGFTKTQQVRAMTTTQRNSGSNYSSGEQIFDTTLNKPVWRNASNNGFVDSTGSSV